MLAALLVLSMVLWFGNDMGDQTQGIIAVLAVLVYVIGFAGGNGAVCWTVMSEVMPTRLRAKAFSLFLSINWFLNLLIGKVVWCTGYELDSVIIKIYVQYP